MTTPGKFLAYDANKAENVKLVLTPAGDLNPPTWKIEAIKGVKNQIYLKAATRNFKTTYLSYNPKDCKSSDVFLSSTKSAWIIDPGKQYAWDMLMPVRNCTTTKKAPGILAPLAEGHPGSCSYPKNAVGLLPNTSSSAVQLGNYLGPHWLVFPRIKTSEQVYGTREPWRMDGFGAVMAMGSPTLLATVDDCSAYAFEKTTHGWERTLLSSDISSKKCSSRQLQRGSGSIAASNAFVVNGNPCLWYMETSSCSKKPVQVYRRSNWKTKPMAIPRPAGRSVNFAESMDMSETVLAIGDPLAGSNSKGAVFVSMLVKNTWAPFIAISPPKRAGKQFGKTVRVSGISIAASAAGNITYIYELTKGAWSLQASVNSPLMDTRALEYVPEVHIDIAGRTLVTSGQFPVASIFRRSGSTWVPDGEIKPNMTLENGLSCDSRCGFDSVALADENTVVLSRWWRPRDDVAVLAEIYTRTAPQKWVKRADLSPESTYWLDMYGWSVVASGNVFVVGAPGGNSDSRSSVLNVTNYFGIVPGAAYIYTRNV